MKIQTLLAKSFLSLAMAAGCLVVLGCSADDGLGRRYSVTGKVTYKGEDVKKGTINFVPTKDGRPAGGLIQDGTYTLTTLTEGDGALPGSYKVTVDTREADQAASKAAAEKYIKEKLKYKGEITQIPPEIQSKILTQTKSSVPSKYISAGTTDITVTVEEKSNTLNIELKD
ncbi:MAG: hypothetical protein U0790_12815 [Isosphaeraceae bacterium]